MNKEYVERDALVRVLTLVLKDLESIVPFGEENKAYKDGSVTAKKGDIDCIKTFPAADVAPVVHGEWILIGADDNDMPIYRCSVCGTKRFGRDYYCGHCGAKMGNNAAARS